MFDSIYFDVGITLGYVLTKAEGNEYDVAGLEAAIERVAEKWPFVSSRVFRDAQSGLYHIRVPKEQPYQPAIKFTWATHATYLGRASAIFSPFGISKRPPLKYFRHLSTRYRTPACASHGHPLVSVHASHLRDATCIGFTFPHGVFDIAGMGQILHAINDELAGRKWSAPPHPERNSFTDTIESLPQDRADPQVLENFKREWPKLSVGSVSRAFLTILLEKIFHTPRTRTLYLDEEMVQALVEPAKQEAKGKGKWVSTGDVLVAWFVKAALSGEAKASKSVSIHPTISFRSTLSDEESFIANYPHNAMAFCPMREFLHSEVDSMTITELAHHHRDHITAIRTPSSIGAIAQHYGPVGRFPPVFGTRGMKKTLFLFSHQGIADLTSLDFGGNTSIAGFWQWLLPLDMDHLVFINPFQKGYLLTGEMRKKRWQALEKDLARRRELAKKAV